MGELRPGWISRRYLTKLRTITIKMHAVQSALAIRRERERRRESVKSKSRRKSSTSSTGIPSDFRPTEERGNGTCNYTTVGISFIILGSLMMVPVFAGNAESLDLDWHHLLGIGGLLIVVGIIMVVVHNCVDADSVDVNQALDKYRVKRSNSHNPIIEDVEYGIDSRRASVESSAEPLPKKFDDEQSKVTTGGIVKV